jgi:cytochrome P450
MDPMTTSPPAATGSPAAYDPDDPALHADPYPAYDLLRERAPQQSRLGVWTFSRYADIMEILRSRDFTSDPYGWDLYPEVAEAIYKDLDCPLLSLQRTWMMLRDGESHRSARRVFTRALSPERVAAAARYAGRVAAERAAALVAQGGGEFMNDVARHVPVRTICHLLAMPFADGLHCQELMDRVLLTFGLSGASADTVRDANDATVALTDYFAAKIDAHLARPGDDVVSDMLRTDFESMSRDEWVANTILLFAAGHETTVNLLGNGCLALMRHPEQLRLLHHEPALAAGVVEETLRYDSPMQVVSRSAGTDTEVGGVSVAAGEHAALMLGAGNRDPRQFDRPDVFDIRRTAGAHLSFGGGPHFCLGAWLARSEAAAAFTVLAPVLGRATVLDDELEWSPTTSHRGLRRLPLHMTGRQGV